MTKHRSIQFMASGLHSRVLDCSLSFTIYACLLQYAFALDCRGQLKSTDFGTRLLDFTTPPAGCSTNRALGYAIGREFGDSIVERIDALGPQLQKALVSYRLPALSTSYNSHTFSAAVRLQIMLQNFSQRKEGQEHGMIDKGRFSSLSPVLGGAAGNC